MADLRTDYKDDVLDTSVNEKRKYRMITNDDGTVSFEDVTEYLQVGDSFGSADVNAITERLTDGVLDTMEEIEERAQENMISGALAVKEFKNSINGKDKDYTTCTFGSKFSGGTAWYRVKNGICFLTLEAIPSEKLVNGDIIVSGLPKPQKHMYLSLGGVQGNYTAQLNATTGNLTAYHPGVDYITRFDALISYPVA